MSPMELLERKKSLSTSSRKFSRCLRNSNNDHPREGISASARPNTKEKSLSFDKESKARNPDDTLTEDESRPKIEESKPLYREYQLGVWTLYFPVTNTWRYSVPTLGTLYALHGMARSTPVIWQFIRETLVLGPYIFALHFVSSALSSLMPSIQLYNNSRVLDLVSVMRFLQRWTSNVCSGQAERALHNNKNRAEDLKELQYALIAYLATLISGWVVRRLELVV